MFQEYIEDVVIGVSRGMGRRPVEIGVKYCDSRDITPVEGYPFMYSVRGSDYDCGRPAAIERSVVINFCGRIFSKEKILEPNEGYLDIKYFCYE